MRTKKIAVMTGTRAEYGLLHGIMRRINENRDLSLQVVVTGTHVSHDFGYTIREILRDGFRVDERISIISSDDSGLGMAVSLGKAVADIAHTLSRLRPDVLLVLGDRLEVLAAAIGATYLNIPIAHIHGGDVSGSVDQPVRYAISKLSHIHFVATSESAARLKKIGEKENRMFIVGAPGVDQIVEKSYATPGEIRRKYGIDASKPFLVLLQHPVVTEENRSAWQIAQTLKALGKIRIQTLVIYPNADAGGRAMIKEIRKYCSTYEFLKSVQSVSRRDFLGILSIASAIVGNSSSAIIEAPSFKLPAVNIGTRQAGRQKARNVLDVNYNTKDIQRAIVRSLKLDLGKLRNPYGDGHASDRIVKTLQQIHLDRFWPKR